MFRDEVIYPTFSIKLTKYENFHMRLFLSNCHKILCMFIQLCFVLELKLRIVPCAQTVANYSKTCSISRSSLLLRYRSPSTHASLA